MNAMEGHAHHDQHVGHDPNMFKRKFWLSLALTIPTIIFSPTVQSWVTMNWSFPGSKYLPAIFGLIVFVYGGMVFLKAAKAELEAVRPGMMTLISMAITVALLYSLASTLKLVNGMDFWWELASLVTIMLLGHWLEMASIQNAEGALKELAKLLPDEAELVVKGKAKKVALDALHSNDIVLVRPGARIPADGKVVDGESAVNESLLTGESAPVKKVVGADVIAGTINGNGPLTVKVVKTGDETMLAGIMRLVADAQASKSATQVIADKAAFYLTFVAVGAALITWLSWALAGQSADFILERVVTVLVIACPHALGLAVPLVVAISTTLGARNGLLIRRRAALETARSVTLVLFDKTGTLTQGQQGVVEIVADNQAELLGLAAAAETKSEHSIARAVVAEAEKRRLLVPDAAGFTTLMGRGVKANIAGFEVYVGGPQLLNELNVRPPETLLKATQIASREGKAVVYVVKAGKCVGAIVLADAIRDESRQAVKQLQAMGVHVAMLTGDTQGVASWVAKELNISEYFAEVLPEHKADTVKKLQAGGRTVAMVGDGVNDAPALAQADVGVAIGAGTDVAIESAGVVLVRDDPRDIVKLLHLSKVTYRKMVQNLVWAAGYNVVAIPLAAGAGAAFGLVPSPAFGAVLMSLSTVIVAANAQLLRRLKL